MAIKNKVERVLSASIIATGLTCGISTISTAESSGRLASQEGSHAEKAHQITLTLKKTVDDLTYTPSKTIPGSVGRMPSTIYQPATYTDVDAARSKIDSAIALEQDFPADTQASQEILREVKKSLPANGEKTHTYSPEINEVNRGSQRFVDGLAPEIRQAYQSYEDTSNRRTGSGVTAILSGLAFAGLFYIRRRKQQTVKQLSKVTA